MSSNKFDRRILELVNEERAKVGVDPLEIDSQIDRVADIHANEMVQANYLSHDGDVSHDGFGERADELLAAGYTFIGENLAANEQPGILSAEEAVNQWMNSPKHKENMLDPIYTHVGVGYGSIKEADDLENYDSNFSGDSSEVYSYYSQMLGATASPLENPF